ncbi:hypothetical protein [Thermococcus sp.]|uniref:hypothetical protein n=1 Tax=Thermococcus sp. TaxID=35749 RepID=UPI0025CBF163|nr:hypothetical protein [Thermococcus sp.]
MGLRWRSKEALSNAFSPDIIPSGRREMSIDSFYVAFGYFMGITYAILFVFIGLWDVQRKKNTLLGESLEDSEELYKAYLGIWALGFLFNPLAYYFSENIYLAMLDGISAFIMLVLGIFSLQKIQIFQDPKAPPRGRRQRRRNRHEEGERSLKLARFLQHLFIKSIAQPEAHGL